MIKNAPPNDEYFSYDINKLPLGFSEPSLSLIKDFKERRNAMTRKLFKLLRNSVIDENSVFCSSPVTVGEFSLILIKEQQN